MSYLQRKTLGYCKKPEAFEGALAINLFDYNYRQFHKSLRVQLPGCPKKEIFSEVSHEYTGYENGTNSGTLNLEVFDGGSCPKGMIYGYLNCFAETTQLLLTRYGTRSEWTHLLADFIDYF